MRFIMAQMAVFMAQESNRRNLRFLRKFFVFIIFLLLLYTSIFHALMQGEGREYSWLTGLYWALTVMSTLGFGDITFTGEPGKMFSILVMLSGILLFMLIMPFTFIRFIYAPWLDAQTKAATPRKLPESMREHTILIGTDNIALSVADKFSKYSIPYCLLLENVEQAFALYDKRYPVVVGDLDEPTTYKNIQVGQAALVVALHDDLRNTNIASTVREVSQTVPMAASADSAPANTVLHMAGCSHVYSFTELLGSALARRVFDINMQSNTIARFEDLCIAEAPAKYVDFVGKTVIEADLRSRFGLNILGVWHGHQYLSVKPDSVIDQEAVMLLAGTADKLEQYDRQVAINTDIVQPPVIILGAGRVGRSAARSLEIRGIDYRLVDKNPKVLSARDKHFILGDASDYEVLEEAGITETNTILTTTHNDDLNIYLTLYCHKLRPEVQIISRATLDKNISSLYKSGASLVMSQASFTANTLMNLLRPEQVFMLTEGLNVFRIRAARFLVGKDLIQSGIRAATGCNVVAVRTNGSMQIPPDPRQPIPEDAELVLIGTEEEETTFRKTYGYLKKGPGNISPT